MNRPNDPVWQPHCQSIDGASFDCDIFDKTSLEAASRLKYSPQKKRVKNVIHQFTYKID